MKPAISVVIPAYNEEKCIGDCLEKLANQDFDLPYEVIVVDNKSTDKTKEVAKKFGARVISEYCKGVVFAFKKGYEAVRSDIVAMTDADTKVPRNWLGRIYEEYQKDKCVVGVAGGFYYEKRSLFFEILRTIQIAIFQLFTTSSGFNMSYKKSALLQVGGIDVRINLGSDVDIFQRLKKVGRCIYLPELKVTTSGRRFEKFNLKYCLIASFTYFSLVFFKKARFHGFEHIR